VAVESKKERWTFFNEEWNECGWEDNVDVLRIPTHPTHDVVED
jgi:hypothetical protein